MYIDDDARLKCNFENEYNVNMFKTWKTYNSSSRFVFHTNVFNAALIRIENGIISNVSTWSNLIARQLYVAGTFRREHVSIFHFYRLGRQEQCCFQSIRTVCTCIYTNNADSDELWYTGKLGESILVRKRQGRFSFFLVREKSPFKTKKRQNKNNVCIYFFFFY